MTILSFFNKIKKVPSHNLAHNDAYSLPENELPKKPHLRKPTDQFFLVLFIASIILLISFLAYTLYHADMNRPDNFDKCGNICGQKNIKLLPWNCSGDDMTDKPHFWVSDEQCHSEPYFWKRQTVNFWEVAGDFALISLLPLGLCLCLILFFRYATAVVVWAILILFLLFLAGLIFTWGYYPYDQDFMIIKVTISVLLLLSFCGLIIMRSKIHLVTMLFRIGTRAVLKHKKIFLLSAVTLLLLCIILVLCVTTTIYMDSAAALIITADNRAYYRINDIMVSSFFLNAAITFWVMEVIIGIYYMTVSGIVAEWYFNRDKSNFRASVSDILCATLKYHLGTIALRSLIVILFGIPQLILKVLEQFLIMNKIMDCVRNVNVFLTKNSYVVTAIHGTPFFQSCRKTINLLMVNVGDTTAVNFCGDLVISSCQLLVVGLFFVTTTLVCSDHMVFAPYSSACFIYVCGISIIFCSIILGTVEAAFNSMLLCICQESLNDNVPNQLNVSIIETLKQNLEKSNPPKISEEVEKPKENVYIIMTNI